MFIFIFVILLNTRPVGEADSAPPSGFSQQLKNDDETFSALSGINLTSFIKFSEKSIDIF